MGERLTALTKLRSLPYRVSAGVPIRLHQAVNSGRGAPPCSGVFGRVRGYGSDVWRLCRGERSQQTRFAETTRRQESFELARVNAHALPLSKTPSTEKYQRGQEVFKCPHRRCRSHGFAAFGSTPSVVSPLASARSVRSRTRPFDRVCARPDLSIGTCRTQPCDWVLRGASWTPRTETFG